MKAILLLIISALIFSYFKDPVVNTVWIFKVSKNANDTLKFKSRNIVSDYDFELNYTMKGTYKFSKDTLIVTIKDDALSEDGGKAIIYRYKYFLARNNTFLSTINIQQFRNNHWELIKHDVAYTGYTKVK
jgi:hypothetical protein